MKTDVNITSATCVCEDGIYIRLVMLDKTKYDEYGVPAKITIFATPKQYKHMLSFLKKELKRARKMEFKNFFQKYFA